MVASAPADTHATAVKPSPPGKQTAAHGHQRCDRLTRDGAAASDNDTDNGDGATAGSSARKIDFRGGGGGGETGEMPHMKTIFVPGSSSVNEAKEDDLVVRGSWILCECSLVPWAWTIIVICSVAVLMLTTVQ